MAQGAIKKPTGKGGLAGRANKPQPPKKGARVVKAKKGKGSSTADKLQKKLAAGITHKTEQLLGERAGHLELIGPGKKARGKGESTKGGSRKFG